jgi:hypothetical protein
MRKSVGKRIKNPAFWHGVLTAHPWFFGEPIREIAINQGTIDVFSAPCKIASGRLIDLRYSGLWGAGLHPRKPHYGELRLLCSRSHGRIAGNLNR